MQEEKMKKPSVNQGSWWSRVKRWVMSKKIVPVLLGPASAGVMWMAGASQWFWMVVGLAAVGAAARRMGLGRPAHFFRGCLLVFFILGGSYSVGLMSPVGEVSLMGYVMALVAVFAYFYMEEGEAGLLAMMKRILDRGEIWRQRTSGTRASAKTKARQSVGAVKTWFMTYRRRMGWAAAGVAAVWALVIGAQSIYRWTHVTIQQVSPTGQVGERVVISATFSGPVELTVASLAQLEFFKIDPPLVGEYRFENKRTVSFVPREPLKPSTEYRVAIDTGQLKAIGKRLERRERFTFHTEPVAVTNANLFYVLDQATNFEKMMVAELNVNYPVDPEALKQHLHINQDGRALDYTLEPADQLKRFYLQTGQVHRTDRDQKITLVVEPGLPCVGGSLPTRQRFERELILPAKPKLEVARIQLHYQPGTTMVTVLFNMPVSVEEVRRQVRIKPALPFEVETEYCYAVLKAEFQPNVDYQIQVLKGLASRSAEVMDHEVKETVRIQDVPALLRFAREGQILPLDGALNLEFFSTNLDEVDIQVSKVFKNQVVPFLQQGYGTFPHPVFQARVEVKDGRLNEEVSQYMNLRQLSNNPYKGLFQIVLNDPKRYSTQASRWFLCTSLGLVAKKSAEDLDVHVIDIKSLAARPGVTLKLMSHNNQVIASTVTDEAGYAVFRSWTKNKERFAPVALVAESGDDFSVLMLGRSSIDRSRFDAGGVPFGERGLEGFITPERGVYRPGEHAYLTAVVRDKTQMTRELVGFPVTMRVSLPDGSRLTDQQAKLSAQGMTACTLDLPAYAKTGEYVVALMVSENLVIGRTSFKVEEFMPDKLKVAITAPASNVKAGQPIVFKVQGRQLFGPPAAGNLARAEVRLLSKAFSHPKFPEFTFSDDTRQLTREFFRMTQRALDANGEAEYRLEVPRALLPPSALAVQIYGEVMDTGGRPVSGVKVMEAHRYPYYLGLRSVKKAAPPAIGHPVTVQYVAVNSEGDFQTLKQVEVVVKRRRWYSIFRKSGWGAQGYQSESYDEIVKRELVDVRGRGELSFLPETEGEYTVLIGSEMGPRARLRLQVAGPAYETWSLESPEKLAVSLDQARFAPGQTAQVSIRSPFPGKLFVSVEREKVYWQKVVVMEGRSVTVSVPVLEAYGPNAYFTAFLVRTPDESSAHLPMTSAAIVPLEIQKELRQLKVELETRPSIRSSDGVRVSVKIRDHEGGAPPGAQLALMAVDEGILQLTKFKTPDPLAHFYQKVRLDTDTVSMMESVLPDVTAKKKAVGGDGEMDMDRRHLNPIAAKRVVSVAAYSGLLTADHEENLTYQMTLPPFNGELRVMALAAAGAKFGSAEVAVKVADPIVLTPILPRFLAPGDECDMMVQVYNQTGQDAEVEVTVQIEGPLRVDGEAKRRQPIPHQTEEHLRFHLVAEGNAGKAVVVITAKTKDGTSTASQRVELAVRPAAHLVSIVRQGALGPGQEMKVLVRGDLIPFGQRTRLSVGSHPLIPYLQGLDYVIAYPYGCAEQTVSRAFPLLSLKDLGVMTGRFAGRANSVQFFVQEAVHKLEKMQRHDGHFQYWSGSDEIYPFISLYAVHFLIEAERAGYRVEPTVMARAKTMVEALNPAPVGRLDRRALNVDREVNLYGLYVKALLRKPDVETMGYVREKKLKALSEMDRALLSLCYAEVGDRAAALAIISPEPAWKAALREMGDWFHAPKRTEAFHLLALAEAGADAQKVTKMSRRLVDQIKGGNFGNTQENVWALLALAKAVKITTPPVVEAAVLIDGQKVREVKESGAVLDQLALGGKTLTLKNSGKTPVYYHFIAEGTPREKSARGSAKGLEVRRTYRDEGGRPLNLTNVVQGQLVVVTVSIKTTRSDLRHCAIVDMLPAGLEVENTRLASRGSVEAEEGDAEEGEGGSSFSLAYQDIRDDRMLLFTGHVSGEVSYTYTARATMPGRYVIPNVFAEAMYDPDLYAESHEPSSLIVVPRQY